MNEQLQALTFHYVYFTDGTESSQNPNVVVVALTFGIADKVSIHVQ